MLIDVESANTMRETREGLVLLDARRRRAFEENPCGIPGALPLFLDEEPIQIPDLPAGTPIIVYCLCRGQTSSTRVAFWLRAAGYSSVHVLEGGFPAWQRVGLPVAEIDMKRIEADRWMPAPSAGFHADRPIAEAAWLENAELPLKRDAAVLFVDMVDSTQLVVEQEPEYVLTLLQVFMEAVVQVSTSYFGDVHDFEGDGAMLYFSGAAEALPAAFAIRDELHRRRAELPELPLARFSIAEGPLVIGLVGTADRRSLAFVGPCINAAARLLKVAPPGGVVAPLPLVENLRSTVPDLTAFFTSLPEPVQLKGLPDSVEVAVAPWTEQHPPWTP